MMKLYAITFALLLYPLMTAHAGEADVVSVKAIKTGNNTYRFDVTVTHNDEGWEHYANKWDIVSPDDNVFKTRTLHHPHVNEQPFTRSLAGIKIPVDSPRVTVRAHDSVHGYGGKVITVELPR